MAMNASKLISCNTAYQQRTIVSNVTFQNSQGMLVNYRQCLPFNVIGILF